MLDRSDHETDLPDDINVIGITVAGRRSARNKIVSFKMDAKPRVMEVIMTEHSKPVATFFEQSASDAATQLGTANKRALDFMFGAQKAMLEEIVFAGNEMLDRARTEMHLFSEFASKMAGSHSVKDVRTMYEECGQHQIDFVRRDCERLFKHGERLIETTSNLFGNRQQG
jgi:hypothetical protein